MRKKRQIYNKICVRKTKTPNLQHQNLRAKKKRQIYNIKIYVRKKNAKFKTSKFTWKKNEKFTTSLTTSRTTLDVCQNIDRGRCPNQYIIIMRHNYDTLVVVVPDSFYTGALLCRP